MQWGFIDYENTGSLEMVQTSQYDRLFIFLGPKNNKIKLGTVSSSEFCTLELISLNTMGSNNLDFHMAFHLGRFHELANKDIEFHIMTNDTGFNGLVSHIKNLGRQCKKISTQKITEENKTDLVLSKCASLIIERLFPLGEGKRPSKKVKLINWIKSQCTQMSNGADPSIYYEELKKAKIIHESGEDITYTIKH